MGDGPGREIYPHADTHSVCRGGGEEGQSVILATRWDAEGREGGDPYILGCLGIRHAGKGDVTSGNDFSGGSS